MTATVQGKAEEWKLNIEAEEWMIAAGLIGLYRLCPDDGNAVTSSGYVLKSAHLNGLAEKYVRYLLDFYSVAEREKDRMSRYEKQLDSPCEKIKDYAKKLGDMMDYQIEKVKKYFSEREEYRQLVQLRESMKKICAPEEYDQLKDAVKLYVEVMSKPLINQKLTMNYVKSVILQHFFGQASILQRTFSSKPIEEQIARLHKDFVEPAQFEMEFARLWKLGNVSDIQTYLKDNQHHKPFKNWYKKTKKLKTMEELRTYYREHVLPCSLIALDDPGALFATQSFEEQKFVPLGCSNKGAKNFNWDFNLSCSVPISAIASLILLLAPIGFTSYSRQMGNVQSNETYRYFGLVFTKQNFVQDVILNNKYLCAHQGRSEFTDAIIGFFDETVDKDEKLQNDFFILEFCSNYGNKKTLLDYYHMPAYLVSFFYKHTYLFKGMKCSQLRDKLLREVLQGVDAKQVIYEYIRIAIKEPFHAYGASQAVMARLQILNFMQGVDKVTRDDHNKRVSYIYFQGVNLRRQLTGKVTSGDEHVPYRASGSKKIEGIAYRLLNAVKAGDKTEFMDTVFRMYLSANAANSNAKLSVPSIFIDAYKTGGLDFDTIANSFITGLLSTTKEEEKKEEASTYES